MKWFFIILLVFNVVYFGWELDRQTIIETKNSTAPFVIPKNIEKLVLVSELDSPPELKNRQLQDSISQRVNSGSDYNATADDSLGQLTDDVMIEKEFSTDLVSKLPEISADGIEKENNTDPLCFTYGPFPAIEQADELVDWFKERSILVNQRTEGEKEKQLFWIYLAPKDSRESAIAAIEDLKSKGVRDFRLINSGDLLNAISLGLFSTQASVNKRLNELKSKGYQPIVVPYHQAEEIFWVDVKVTDTQNLLNELFTDFPSRFNSIPMSCAEIALL